MIASAIISGLGTAASGIMSYLNNKKATQQAEAEAARQVAYAEGKAAENPLSTSQAQAAIGEYNRKAQETMDNARARDKVLGTNTALQTQKNMAEGYGTMMSGIGAQGTERADKWSSVAEEARRNKAAGDQERAAARNATYAALAANAANAMSGLWSGDDKGVPTEGLASAADATLDHSAITGGGNGAGQIGNVNGVINPIVVDTQGKIIFKGGR